MLKWARNRANSLLEILKKKSGRGANTKARLIAWRAKQRAILPPEEFERRQRHSKSQQEWLARQTPEYRERRAEGKRERQRRRHQERKKKKAKAAE
jgi:hypothetical protein